MNKVYDVTLAMPVYNVESRVKDSLLSALNQTFESIEFLIIDDKGTDKSIEVVKELIAEHPRGKHVKIIDHGINRGTGATKNTAIKEARGAYLFFMDSDDFITPNCIENLYSLIKNKNIDVVAGSYAIFDSDLKFNSVNYLGNYNNSLTLCDHVYKYYGMWNTQTWNKLYRVSFLRENDIKCIPHHLCEDVYFQFQVVLLCKTYICTNKVTYLYIRNNNSVTAGGTGYRYQFAKMFGEAIFQEFHYIRKLTCLNNEMRVKQRILFDYRFLFMQIINSTYMTEEEKDELFVENIRNFKTLLNSDLYKNYGDPEVVIEEIVSRKTFNTLQTYVPVGRNTLYSRIILFCNKILQQINVWITPNAEFRNFARTLSE